MIVAIDGPAGSGKSTVAKRVAARLRFHYLDTGAMYRSLAYAGQQAGADLDDDVSMTVLAKSILIEFEHQGGSALPTRVLLDGEDVTAQIRTPDADRAVSHVASLAGVRAVMVERQRLLGAGLDLVAEGRDIGTVVFPDAELKIFLTASAEERARRRHLEMSGRGETIDQSEVLTRINTRDAADTERETSPLVMAADAVELDTTGLEIDEVVERIARLVEERT